MAIIHRRGLQKEPTVVPALVSGLLFAFGSLLRLSETLLGSLTETSGRLFPVDHVAGEYGFLIILLTVVVGCGHIAAITDKEGLLSFLDFGFIGIADFVGAVVLEG